MYFASVFKGIFELLLIAKSYLHIKNIHAVLAGVI